MLWCTYKNALGRPRQGFHSTRVLDIAVNDLIGTLVIAGVVAWLRGESFVMWAAALLALGVLLHWLFCVDTTVNGWLFGKA